jgi:hypothetical protein
MNAQQLEGLNEVNAWRNDIIVQGYPGKTVCHGGLLRIRILTLRFGTATAPRINGISESSS